MSSSTRKNRTVLCSPFTHWHSFWLLYLLCSVHTNQVPFRWLTGVISPLRHHGPPSASAVVYDQEIAKVSLILCFLHNVGFASMIEHTWPLFFQQSSPEHLERIVLSFPLLFLLSSPCFYLRTIIYCLGSDIFIHSFTSVSSGQHVWMFYLFLITQMVFLRLLYNKYLDKGCLVFWSLETYMHSYSQTEYVHCQYFFL